jgi:hypothetical protein
MILAASSWWSWSGETQGGGILVSEDERADIVYVGYIVDGIGSDPRGVLPQEQLDDRRDQPAARPGPRAAVQDELEALRGGGPKGTADRKKAEVQELLRGLGELMLKRAEETSEGDDGTATEKPPKKKPKKFDLFTELKCIVEKPPKGDLIDIVEQLARRARGVQAGRQQSTHPQNEVGEASNNPKNTNTVQKQTFYSIFKKKPEVTAKSSAKVHKPKVVPGVWKHPIGAEEAMQHLQEGVEPPADAVVCTVMEAHDLLKVAEQHSLKTKVQLLIHGVQDSMEEGKVPPGATTTYVATDRGVESMWRVPLVKDGASDVKVKTVVKQVTVQDDKLVAVARICARKELIPDANWDDLLKHPGLVIGKVFGVKGELRLYGWKQERDERSDWVFGYVQADAAIVKELVQKSGIQGIFIKEVGNDAIKQEPVQWLSRLEKEDPKEYFERCAEMARSAGKSMALRKGGGGCIGIRGASGAIQRSRFVVHGTPRSWGPDTVKKFMADHGWQHLGVVQPPRKPWEGFLVSAAPAAAEVSNDIWIYKFGDKEITIREWVRGVPQRRPTTRSLQNVGWSSWAPSTKGDEKGESRPPQSSAGGGEGAGGVASPRVKRQCLAADSQAMDVEAGNAEPTPTQSTPQAPEHTERIEVKVLKGEGPQGTDRWDLGGAGDCGFRAVACAIALKNGATRDNVEDKIAKIAKTVHTRMVTTLEQTKGSWQPTWRFDNYATEETESGPIPKTADEWLEAARRPKRWLCWRGLQALATTWRFDILVWEQSKAKSTGWVLKVRFQAAKKASENYICLALKDDHFTTIPVEGTATKWQKSPGELEPISWKGRGAMNNESEDEDAWMLRSAAACSTARAASTSAVRAPRSRASAASTAKLLRSAAPSASSAKRKRSTTPAARSSARSSTTRKLLRPGPDKGKDAEGDIANHHDVEEWEIGRGMVCPCGWRPDMTGITSSVGGAYSTAMSRLRRHEAQCHGGRKGVTKDSRYYSLVGSRSRGHQISAAKAQQTIRDWQQKHFHAKPLVKKYAHIVDADDRIYLSDKRNNRWRCSECHEELNVWRICNAPCKARLPSSYKEKVGTGKQFRKLVMTAVQYKKWLEIQERHNKRTCQNQKLRRMLLKKPAASRSSS